MTIRAILDTSLVYTLGIPSTGPSVQFNATTDTLCIEEMIPVQPVRDALDVAPQRDGGITHDAFLGGILLTMRGRVTAEGGIAWRREKLEDLQAVLVAMLRTDGELTWTIDGGMTITTLYGLRLGEDLQVGKHASGAHVKSWEFQLISKSAVIA